MKSFRARNRGLDGNLDQYLNGAIQPQRESFITSQRQAGGPSFSSYSMSPAGGTPLQPKGAGKVSEQK